MVFLFVMGILTGRYLPFFLSFLPFLYLVHTGLIFFAFLSYFQQKKRLTTLLVFTIIFLWGGVYFCLHYFPSPGDIVRFAPSKHQVHIVGKIVNRPRVRKGKRKRITFIMEAERIKNQLEESWHLSEGKIWITSFFPYKYYGYGDVVRIKGKLNIPRGAGKEGDFNWQKYLSYQGIWTQINTGKVEVIKKNQGNPLLHLAFSTADWIRSVIDQSLPYPSSAALKGMMLGDREDLPPDILSSFRTTGTAHVLVVSGLHIGLLFFTVFTLVRVVGFSLKGAFALCLPVIIYYAFLTGLRQPIVRASLMATIGIICYFLDRKVPLIVVLSLAAFLVLLINPLSLFTVSFQLSFLAVGGIIHLAPYVEKKVRFLPPFLRKSFSVSTAAQLSLLPLLAFYFGQFPLIGFAANLLVVPPLTGVLSLGFICLVLATFTLQGAQIFFNTTWLLLKGFLFLINGLSFSWKPGLAYLFSPQLTSPPLWLLFIYYSLLILLPSLSSFSLKGRLINTGSTGKHKR